MLFEKTDIASQFIINLYNFKDKRGDFIKIFSNSSIFQDLGLNLLIKENYISKSKKNALRGFHVNKSFKLLTCLSGKILDVTIDLRKKSKTFLKIYKTKINYNSNKAILIPPGVAHAYLCLQDNTLVSYLSDKNYNPNHEKILKWNEIDFKWPCKKPILSFKDSNGSTIHDYLKNS